MNKDTKAALIELVDIMLNANTNDHYNDLMEGHDHKPFDEVDIDELSKLREKIAGKS